MDAILTNCPKEDLNFENIYCVGRRTKRLVERRIGKVVHAENYGKDLANYLAENLKEREVTYFCSDLRLDYIPEILTENNIKINEIEAYQTKYDAIEVAKDIEGVMFYSPSTVQSFIKKNHANGIAFCIGDSTALEARKHFKDVRVAKIPTVESVIELVNEHYN